MSLAAITARVEELQALVTRPVGAPQQPPQTSFAAALTSASPIASTTMTGAGAWTPAAAPAGGPGEGTYDDLITTAAERNGVDPALLKGLVQQESGFNPNAGSPAGAQGLTQLMPGTAAALGVSNPLDPAQSLEGGARYLRQQLDAFGGDPALALAAYNAGPGAVRRHGGVPPYAETQHYVQQVLSNAAAYRGAIA